MSHIASKQLFASTIMLVWQLGSYLVYAQQSSAATPSRSVTVSNTSRYVGDGRWDWTVFVRGPSSIVDKIQCVEYTLHPTFPNPVRSVCVRGKDNLQPFALSSNGWGEFTIMVRILFRDGKQQRLSYPLKLTQ